MKMSPQASIVSLGKRLTVRGAMTGRHAGSTIYDHQGEQFMAISDILASIDHEIAQLQQARALLSGSTAPAAKKKAGRPKKVAAAVAPAAMKLAKKKRNLSPEGRKRIVEAMKRRWAAKKKAGVTVVPAAKTPAKKAKKRHISPETRKRIAEAAKQRWVAKRAAAAVVPATTEP